MPVIIFQDESNPDGFSCSLCDNRYKLEIMLQLHMAAAHPNQTQHLFNKGTIRLNVELNFVRTYVRTDWTVTSLLDRNIW